MKRLLGSFNRKGSTPTNRPQTAPQGDSPDSTIVREVILFCESNAPNSPNAGEEYLHLPAIVEAAESSPAAAKAGANCIRKFLTKDYTGRAYAQYNAVMLMRILTDNPGRTFTRNFDAVFVKTVKELLREGRDLSVQQILRETLDSFATVKTDNETMGPLLEMWKREKAKSNTKVYGNSVGPRAVQEPSQPAQAGNHFARHHRQSRSLPPPDELVARIEEAKTTAKLLSQTVQSTPAGEIPNHDLIKEFADRASSASRSIQGYIHCQNPAPDEDTLLTLIETNDQLSVAMSKHQRALLQARRTLSVSSPAVQQQEADQVGYAAPQGPPPGAMGAGRPQEKNYAPYSPPQSPSHGAADHMYAPPINPPPQATQVMQWPPQQQQQPPSPSPPRRRDQTNNRYDVPDNPFTDEAYNQSQQQQQHSPNLFSGLSNKANINNSVPVGGMQSEPLQPRPPNQALTYHPTPDSYVYRHEPAPNSLAMHGASPPPAAVEGRGRHGDGIGL